MTTPRLPGGVVHALPADLRGALLADLTARQAWTGITPLARNEFICWVEDAKQDATRARRVRRTKEELEEPDTEGQLRVLALEPELVWLAHEHEPWRPRTV